MERQPTTDRMIQEYVPGKQVTLAHLIANPGKDLFKKASAEKRRLHSACAEKRFTIRRPRP